MRKLWIDFLSSCFSLNQGKNVVRIWQVSSYFTGEIIMVQYSLNFLFFLKEGNL